MSKNIDLNYRLSVPSVPHEVGAMLADLRQGLALFGDDGRTCVGLMTHRTHATHTTRHSYDSRDTPGLVRLTRTYPAARLASLIKGLTTPLVYYSTPAFVSMIGCVCVCVVRADGVLVYASSPAALLVAAL